MFGLHRDTVRKMLSMPSTDFIARIEDDLSTPKKQRHIFSEEGVGFDGGYTIRHVRERRRVVRERWNTHRATRSVTSVRRGRS